MSKLALVLAVQGIAIAGLLVLALDQYAHKRVEGIAGVNARGYRGSVMLQRRPNEVRIAVVGGNHAFGWGVVADETAASRVRAIVQRARRPQRRTTAVNLGAPGLPLRDYSARMRHFRYLEPDVICLHFDLIDASSSAWLPPSDSGVRTLTGYVPILPLVLEEKGRRVADAGPRLAGLLLARAGRTLRGVDRRLHDLVAGSPPPGETDRREALRSAVDAAMETARGVVAILPAPQSPAEEVAHTRMRQVLVDRVRTEPRLRLVDLGEHAASGQGSLRLEGMDFDAAGHALVAEAVAPAVIDVLERELTK